VNATVNLVRFREIKKIQIVAKAEVEVVWKMAKAIVQPLLKTEAKNVEDAQMSNFNSFFKKQGRFGEPAFVLF
jgi:hypothetical protein